MQQYDKIDVSEGIDVNKTSASKEYEFCHYWFFTFKIPLLDLNLKNMFVVNVIIY